ncbi:MAG: DUF92 domain-containing protein [Balneolaceae bacterium]|nr:MAG: DUF92 domain-containing protein [Balneolaceae bacterium]
MYRLTNYVFLFAVLYLFILEAKMSDHNLIFIAFILSSIVAFAAFLWNWITLDAIKSIIILGTIVLGFSGWYTAFALIFFFISGSLLSGRNKVYRESMEVTYLPVYRDYGRRDGYQVWANGFWLAIFCLGWFLTGSAGFLIAAFTTIATATADTWATEIGTHKPGKTVSILTLIPVQSGEDGGISLKGSIAAISGAAFISLFLLFSEDIIPKHAAFLVFIFGLSGCFIDSVLGAVYRKKNWKFSIPKDFSEGGNDGFTNSLINWASTGTSGILAIIITYIFY